MSLDIVLAVILHIEEEAMSLSVFYYCIGLIPCHCHTFNSLLCHLLPCQLSCVAVSRPCHLLEFYPSGASIMQKECTKIS